MCESNPKQWASWLPMAKLWYNTSFHTALNITPFVTLYGFKPTMWVGGRCTQTNVKEVVELVHNRQLVQQLKEHLRKAHKRIKLYADKKILEKSFQEGDCVYVKLKPYRQRAFHSQKA